MPKGKNKASAGAKATEGSTPVRPSEVMVLIKESTLKKLLAQDDRYKQDIDGLTGELREAIGNAQAKQHLDTKAYALLKRFHREKSNEKLASLWHTLLAYMDMAGVMERIDSVQALSLDGERAPAGEAEDDADDDTGGEPTTGSVSRPTFGGGRAAH